MPRVPAFHSVYEAMKSPLMRVCHTNDLCTLGRSIPEPDRKSGSGNHPICKECDRLNRAEPNKWV